MTLISYRYKLGRCTEKPLPRCRICGEYTHYSQSIVDWSVEWLECPKCGAKFDFQRNKE
jgi:hypothetical protein